MIGVKEMIRVRKLKKKTQRYKGEIREIGLQTTGVLDHITYSTSNTDSNM
jgi:hypothetical protein